MTDRSLIFTGPMVRAILNGHKTMTRRTVNNPDTRRNWAVGDLIWVKETYGFCPGLDADPFVYYRADNPEGDIRWKSPLFMPRKFSRLALEIKSLRVERLQEITKDDAIREGASNLSWERQPNRPTQEETSGWSMDWSEIGVLLRDGSRITAPQISSRVPAQAFSVYWNRLTAGTDFEWSDNPLVRVIEFARVKP
jgi:hypothetical protein